MFELPALVGPLAVSSVPSPLALSPVPALLGLDPLFVVLAVAFLGIFLFGFLLLRKTVLGFREGVDEGRR